VNVRYFFFFFIISRALAADAPRELNVLRHDRDALGVDRAQVRVLEQPDEVRLGRLLQREDGVRLEPKVRLEVLRDLADEPLERELADEQLRGLLVLPVRWERARRARKKVRSPLRRLPWKAGEKNPETATAARKKKARTGPIRDDAENAGTPRRGERASTRDAREVRAAKAANRPARRLREMNPRASRDVRADDGVGTRDPRARVDAETNRTPAIERISRTRT
jgi:hypothetical protein